MSMRTAFLLAGIFLSSLLSAPAASAQAPDPIALANEVTQAQTQLTALENQTMAAMRDSTGVMVDQAAQAVGVTLTPAQRTSILNGSLASIWDPLVPPSADEIKNAVAQEMINQVGSALGMSADAALAGMLANIDPAAATAVSDMFSILGNMETMAGDVESLLLNLSNGVIPTGLDVNAVIAEFQDAVQGAFADAAAAATDVANEIIETGTIAAGDALQSLADAVLGSEAVDTALSALGVDSGALFDAASALFGDAVGGIIGNVVGGLVGDYLGGLLGGTNGSIHYTGMRNYYPPFGGFVEEVFYCTCSFNILTILDENRCTEGVPPTANANLAAPSCLGSPRVLSYVPWSTSLYPYYQIYEPGVWLLGLWRGLDACRVYVGSGCITVGYYPHMTMVGTSLEEGAEMPCRPSTSEYGIRPPCGPAQ